MSARVSWHEARAIAGASAAAVPAEIVPLDSCVGRTLITDLETATDLPHFASAAMDGWLVVGDGPWTITDDQPGPGQARRIVTGAAVPPSATAVLRSESATTSSGSLTSMVPHEPRPGQHVRLPGTEAVHGEIIIAGGTVLNPAHVALAASAGVDVLAVHAVPAVAVVLTGDEVVTNGMPTAGQVRDSFGVQLPALIAMLGGHVTGSTRVGDNLAHTIDAIHDSVEPLVVTTGGTGSSAADHIRAALRVLGARFLVDGVAMRPGGPTTVAQLPDGRLVASLPGNPLAAMVAAITICEPLLASLAGRDMRKTLTVKAVALEGKPGSTTLVPYTWEGGRLSVARWRGSAMMRGLAEASGLLVVPAAGLADGDRAEAVAVPWPVPIIDPAGGRS